MNNLQRGILILLKSGITGEKLTLPEDFSLEAAYPIIRRHQIMTLAYNGAVICGCPQTHPVMQTLFKDYYQCLVQSERQMKAVEQICKAFEQHGIDYMPLKGCKMKALYPKPELRLMGDADILIRIEQYDRIIPVMKELCFENKSENDHELVWCSANLYLELHKRIMPSSTNDYYAYFGDGWTFAKNQAGSRYDFTAEDEYIFQFAHFAKHYRGGGIGLRHTTDLWVYKNSFPRLDYHYIEKELKKLQLLEFYRNICRLIEVWFEDGEDDEKSSFISDFIFKSGSWGSGLSHALSSSVKISKEGNSFKEGRIKLAVRTLFPDLKTMQYKYSILRKVPWLLPIFWGLRGVTAILFKKHNVRGFQKNLHMVTPDNIRSYQEALQYVGLDFNFEEK